MKINEIIVKPQLSKWLKKKRINQHELSNLTGVNQATISRFDSQTRHDDRHLFAIAHALGIKIEDLFEVTFKEDVS